MNLFQVCIKRFRIIQEQIFNAEDFTVLIGVNASEMASQNETWCIEFDEKSP